MATHAPNQTTWQNGQVLNGAPHGRLDVAQTAQILGFEIHDIPIIVSAGFLKPLGKPVPNARKYFAAVHVLEKANDSGWLGKATQAVYQHWQRKNAARTQSQVQEQ